MEPLPECEATQIAMSVRPSAASMAGSSTGHRLKGAQLPFISWAEAALAGEVLSGIPTATATNAPRRAGLTLFGAARMIRPAFLGIRESALAEQLSQRSGLGFGGSGQFAGTPSTHSGDCIIFV
ncbi:hypothetical protein GCM10015535_01740 [Streptomyces gelaticus]|uniref:Uncharacterized protein n=1 Tax=Streptomyces gelaticus TaxID=285446 RepID=A0ABQ2VQC5_9ACTN|nr:hypothetical protein GCM10015535_01740 [Streptomyces gelaticus]